MAVASLEMSRTFKRKDPESYKRIIKKLFCENIGVEFEENYFTYEDNLRRDSAGCLSVIMTQKTAIEGQHTNDDITEQRVGSLYQVIEHLGLGVNISEEGIFRKAGRVKNQLELLEKVERGVDLELERGQYSTHECASVLKTFLSRLSEPLVTTSCYKAHLAICSLNEEEFERKLYCTQLLLELIPDQYHRLLKDLLFLLHGVAQRSDENKMSATNLAMMFCSHIICPKTLSAEEIQAKHSIFTKSTTFMIEHPSKLFTLPEKLLTEIHAFLSRRSSEGRLSLARRGNQGPGVEVLIANTVFSFVEKQEEPNSEETRENSMVGKLESTVVSQLNLSIDILDIKNKE